MEIENITKLMEKINFATSVYLMDKSGDQFRKEKLSADQEAREAKQIYIELKILVNRLSSAVNMGPMGDR